MAQSPTPTSYTEIHFQELIRKVERGLNHIIRSNRTNLQWQIHEIFTIN